MLQIARLLIAIGVCAFVFSELYEAGVSPWLGGPLGILAACLAVIFTFPIRLRVERSYSFRPDSGKPGDPYLEVWQRHLTAPEESWRDDNG